MTEEEGGVETGIKSTVRQPSILSFFLSLGAALFLMALSVIGTMIYGVTVQNRLQEEFTDRTSMSDQILLDLYEMEQAFRELGREWNNEQYGEYLKLCEELKKDTEAFAVCCRDVPVTQNYIRRINNFNIYQQECLARVMEGTQGRYDVYIYVINGLELHQQQALEMTQHDTAYARRAYEGSAGVIFRQMIVMAMVFGMMAVVMGGVLIHFSTVARRTMGGMTEYFNRLAASEWETPDLGRAPYREFTLIAQTANRMKEEIRASIKEIENRARLEKQLAEERLINEKQKRMLIAAQMSALRAQVNPHFLFNSLNLIGVTALVGDSKTVMQMVEATGNILRYSLYHQESMTALDEEVDIVFQYLFLQKCRFNDAVNAEVHNDLEGEDIQIPTMSLQPIVENCFKHGFGNKKSLHIHIAITWEGDKVLICVTDNGMGLDPEQVLREDGSGIGLRNIRRRLELIYGSEEAAIKIEGEPGEYSSISLLIPPKGGVM